MTMLTFRPPVAPSPGTSYMPQLKILDAEFGDGYSQPTPNGLNHIRNTVGLAWDALTLQQMQTIVGFFVRHGGTRTFHYAPFGARGISRWTCRDWTHTADNGVWKVTATLVQSFSAAG